MNRHHDSNDAPDLAATIDRLVAGDLAAGDRRALLLKLESTPDAWRQCALAFLEDQAWRAALTQPPLERERIADLLRFQTPSNPRMALRQSIPYASAAVIFAMGCGLAFQAGTWTRWADPAVAIASPSRSPDAKLVGPSTQPGEPIGWIGLIDPAAADARPLPVPVLVATDANERWLHEQPAAIPDYVRAQWERRGFVVEENRRLVDLGLQDGQPVAIPVDEVAVDYVGRQPL